MTEHKQAPLPDDPYSSITMNADGQFVAGRFSVRCMGCGMDIAHGHLHKVRKRPDDRDSPFVPGAWYCEACDAIHQPKPAKAKGAKAS